jgi:hypothetical protein
MNRFNARSPYIISVDGDPAQVGTKISIYIVAQDNSTLLLEKTIEKKMFSPTQRINHYNISPYVYDILNSLIENSFACNVYIDKYWFDGTDYHLMTEELIVATDGYSDYNSPNYLQTANFIPLTKEVNYPIYYDRSLPFPTADFIFDFITAVNDYYYEISNGAYSFSEPINNLGFFNFIRLPLTIAGSEYSDKNTFKIFRIDEEEPVLVYRTNLVNLCEQKYNPIKLDFINRLGGMQSMYFFKNSTQSIEVKSSEYNANTFLEERYPTYNQELGQKRIYNKNGSKTIKCNSGWINELENENIQDIMLSENLLLTYDEEGTIVSKAVTLKSSSQLFKTHLNEKVINYELEFEVASALINNVV